MLYLEVLLKQHLQLQLHHVCKEAGAGVQTAGVSALGTAAPPRGGGASPALPGGRLWTGWTDGWGHSMGRGNQTSTGRQGQGDENCPRVWGENGLPLKPATLRFSEDLPGSVLLY